MRNFCRSNWFFQHKWKLILITKALYPTRFEREAKVSWVNSKIDSWFLLGNYNFEAKLLLLLMFLQQENNYYDQWLIPCLSGSKPWEGRSSRWLLTESLGLERKACEKLRSGEEVYCLHIICRILVWIPRGMTNFVTFWRQHFLRMSWSIVQESQLGMKSFSMPLGAPFQMGILSKVFPFNLSIAMLGERLQRVWGV